MDRETLENILNIIFPNNAQWTHELKVQTNAKLALTVELPIGERTLLSILCYAIQVFVGEDGIDHVNIDAVTTRPKENIFIALLEVVDTNCYDMIATEEYRFAAGEEINVSIFSNIVEMLIVMPPNDEQVHYHLNQFFHKLKQPLPLSTLKLEGYYETPIFAIMLRSQALIEVDALNDNESLYLETLLSDKNLNPTELSWSDNGELTAHFSIFNLFLIALTHDDFRFIKPLAELPDRDFIKVWDAKSISYSDDSGELMESDMGYAPDYLINNSEHALLYLIIYAHDELKTKDSETLLKRFCTLKFHALPDTIDEGAPTKALVETLVKNAKDVYSRLLRNLRFFNMPCDNQEEQQIKMQCLGTYDEASMS